MDAISYKSAGNHFEAFNRPIDMPTQIKMNKLY